MASTLDSARLTTDWRPQPEAGACEKSSLTFAIVAATSGASEIRDDCR